jgi:WD40 repeat protein
MKIALAGPTVVVSLPWDSAFYVFHISDGISQPAIVNRVHRERITAIAASGALLATAAKDFSVRIWRMENRFTLVAFAMKHRTPVKLIAINKKLQICVSVGFDGFVLALSTVNGRFLHGIELHESDPSLLAFSNFGCVLVAFNQKGNCLVKVVDQNLRLICERRMSYAINCWKYVHGSDGGEYLIASLSNRRLVLLKIPFMEELDLDFQTNFAVAAVDCVLEPLGVLLTDTAGNLFCIRPYSHT